MADAHAALDERDAQVAAHEAAAAEAAAAVDKRATTAEAAAAAIAAREAELQRLQGEVWSKVRQCCGGPVVCTAISSAMMQQISLWHH